MSVQAMTWVFERSASSGNARLVLLSVANHADRDGANAWPAIGTIGIEARCSPATVKRSIAELRSIGELDWLQGGGREGARRKSNYYWLPVMRMQLGLPRDPSTAHLEPLSGNAGSSRRGQGLKRVRDKGSPVSHEPSLNHPEPVGVNAGQQNETQALSPEGRALARAVVELAKKKAMPE